MSDFDKLPGLRKEMDSGSLNESQFHEAERAERRILREHDQERSGKAKTFPDLDVGIPKHMRSKKWPKKLPARSKAPFKTGEGKTGAVSDDYRAGYDRIFGR